MALTKAQRDALNKVQATVATSRGARAYEVEQPLNEAGVTIHFTPGAERSNQGRFWFAIDGEDSGLSFTSRGGARKGAEAYLAALEPEA